MTKPPVAPDDTPTRLLAVDWQPELTRLRAEVSRLREALAKSEHNGTNWMIGADLDHERAEKLEADVSRLQQERDNLGVLLKRGLDIMEEAKAERAKLLEENALLRRSLEMLTKQLDEKDERITELTFTIIRHNSPA
jgi:seryl-tRNA synthetase